VKLIPTLDVSKGVAVKRVKGVPGTGLSLGSPKDVAQWILDMGYESLHIVDLDAAAEEGRNTEQLIEVLRLPFKWIQIGGGIRDVEVASLYLRAGASALVLSTLPFTDPVRFRSILANIGGDKLLVSIDYSDGKTLLKGWRKEGIPLERAIEIVSEFKLRGTILTHVSREGTKSGVEPEALKLAPALPGIREYAGGVAELSHLLQLKEAGFHAALVGMAFYDGKLRGVKDV
jgi:phosphoribosylformimino-5-aminoimidazole carboxamide ribotide isomerase